MFYFMYRQLHLYKTFFFGYNINQERLGVITMQKRKTAFALYFGNRGFFPGELVAQARKEMINAVQQDGCDFILMDESSTRYGAVETAEEGQKYAAFLKENAGKYDGVILSLPNFGDENGAI